jgi:hypothetical protein
MAEGNTEQQQPVDPEAQKTADLISKLMSDLTDEGREPSDDERVRRLFQAQDEIDNQIVQAKLKQELVEEHLIQRVNSLVNVRIGVQKAVRARGAVDNEATRAMRQFGEDFSDPTTQSELLQRERVARESHRNRGNPPSTSGSSGSPAT